jgi:hypothetical protein
MLEKVNSDVLGCPSGSWVEGRREGQGQMFWRDGDRHDVGARFKKILIKNLNCKILYL